MAICKKCKNYMWKETPSGYCQACEQKLQSEELPKASFQSASSTTVVQNKSGDMKMNENNKQEVLSDEEQRKRRKELALQQVAAKKNKKHKATIIGCICGALVLILTLAYFIVLVPKQHFDQGVLLRDSGKWDEAVAEFEQAGMFAHGGEEVKHVRYLEGEAKREAKDWDGAAEAFHAAGDYSDAATQELAMYYANGEEKRGEQKWEEAIVYFEKAKSYKDSAEQITETLYQKANWLLSCGNSEEAYDLFKTILGYSDVKEILQTNSTFVEIHKTRYANFSIVGAEVTFGRLEQDEDTSNGEEPITWIVLACDGNKALLLSKYALGDEQQYEKEKSISWEQSSIKPWLERMKKRAFTENEQSAINGELTLMTSSEVYDYLPEQETRICRKLKDVKEKGEEARGTSWWLMTSVSQRTYESSTPRSNGYVHVEKKKKLVTPGVSYEGKIDYWSPNAKISIRPIMWVDLQAMDDIV